MNRIQHKKNRNSKFIVISISVFLIVLIMLFKNVYSNKNIDERANQNPLAAIDSKRYPEINFTPEEISIETLSQVSGWELWESPKVDFTIQHPLDRKPDANDWTGVGFCQPKSCQDFYPVVMKVTDKSLLDVVDQAYFCNTGIHPTCYDRNITIAPFKLGQYQGIALYQDKLTKTEKLQKEQTGAIVYPAAGGGGFFYLLINNKLYEFLFDPSNDTEKQMIATFKLK